MAYLVRKLNKRDNIVSIGQATSIQNMVADAVTGEFRTKNGCLSTWRIEKLDALNEAILAIVVTSSKIERMDFIVIDTMFLDQQHFVYAQTYAGQDIAVPDLQDTHYDISEITISRLVDCAKLYQCVYRLDDCQEKYIVRCAEGEIKDILKQAYNAQRIKMELLNNGIKKGLI